MLLSTCSSDKQEPRQGAATTAPPTPTFRSLRDAAPAADATPVATSWTINAGDVANKVAAAPNETWFGIYLSGQKIGHMHRWVRATRGDEPGGFAVGWSTVLVRNRRAFATIHANAFYAAKAPHGLVELRRKQSAAGQAVVSTYTAAGDAVVARKVVAGIAEPKRRLPPTGETLSAAWSFAPTLDARTLRVGMVAQLPSFNADQERESTVQVRVAAVTASDAADTGITIVEDRGEDGAEARYRLDVAGNLLELSIGGEYVLRREHRAKAKRVGRGFTRRTIAVKVSRPLGDPRRLEGLAMQLKAPKGMDIPSLPNQTVSRGKDGTFDIQTKRGPSEKVTAAAQQAALQETFSVDFSSPAIAKLAPRIIAGHPSTLGRVRAINDWQRRLIKQRDGGANMTASQVLATKAGGCRSHTILFLALARAVGIPARRVNGLVYHGDDRAVFVYRPWAEVDLNGRWTPVDPCWMKTEAHPARIRLSAGPLLRWPGDLRRTKLRVLRVVRRAQR